MREIAMEVTNSYGAIERIFRVVRHRRFSVCHCDITTNQQQKFAIKLTVAGSKSIDNLLEQLKKLVDVEYIGLVEKNKRQVVETAKSFNSGALSYAT
ncbi:MAG: acetolactate synthase 2 small subunit [Gammaproteobacteria bacterium]|nr:acetolactate synthase 2 small subunit [Gammaproteobacteria bacterium]